MKTRITCLNLIRGGGLVLAALALALLPAGGISTAQEPDAAHAARAYLERNAASLGIPAGLRDLRVESVREGLTGRHVRYQQTANGVPVFGASVTVSLPDGGKTPVVLSRYVRDLKVPPPQVTVGPADAAAAWQTPRSTNDQALCYRSHNAAIGVER